MRVLGGWPRSTREIGRARWARGVRHSTADRRLGQPHQLLCGWSPVMAWSQFMQGCSERLHLGLRDGLGAWIAFENRQRRRPRGIGKYLGEFEEQHHQQAADRILVTHNVIPELF